MHWWAYWFHLATDIFIMLVILYIFLVLLEFRREIYTSRRNRPRDVAENEDYQIDHSDKNPQRT